jgi:hypothetical protein
MLKMERNSLLKTWVIMEHSTISLVRGHEPGTSSTDLALDHQLHLFQSPTAFWIQKYNVQKVPVQTF